MRNYRPTWVEVSGGAFSSNLEKIKNHLGPQVGILAVLKADAYGHGAEALAPIAASSGVAIIGVSSLEEALALRESGVKIPILLLGSIYPLENFSVALENNLIPTVASLEAAEVLKEIAERAGKIAEFHLKVDTGMGRIGVSMDGAKKVLSWIKSEKNLRLAGVYSHLASVDSDPHFTSQQLRQFETLKEFARGLGFDRAIFHIANSAALLTLKEANHEMVRPGLALYGASLIAHSLTLSPVLSWRSKIIFLKKVSADTAISYGGTFRTNRESVIATLPVGYADGVPRSVSNKGAVLIRGKRCPIVGRVTMDQIMVDVTGMPVGTGEDVTLIGRQQAETISVNDWAEWAQTIPYEIFCGISKRVPRVMVP